MRKLLDRKASQEYPDAKRLLGALANSRGHRHEENAAKLVKAALEMPLEVGAALLASAEGYTPRATKLIDEAREELGTIQEVALALAENLPAPKQRPIKRRRRRRKKKGQTEGAATAAGERRRRADGRRRGAGEAEEAAAAEAEAATAAGENGAPETGAAAPTTASEESAA